MADRAVARRYAQAFVNVLEISRRVEPGLEGLQRVSHSYSQSRDFQRFLGSPEIAPGEKEELVTKIFSDLVGPDGMGLLNLLLQWDRIDHLPLIMEEATAEAELRRGILRGWVTTARPISAKETEILAKAVGDRLGKHVLLERQVDPQLIGGVRVRVGTTVLDGSVQTLLKEVRQKLLEVKI